MLCANNARFHFREQGGQVYLPAAAVVLSLSSRVFSSVFPRSYPLANTLTFVTRVDKADT